MGTNSVCREETKEELLQEFLEQHLQPLIVVRRG
jgi:hypothetical protein